MTAARVGLGEVQPHDLRHLRATLSALLQNSAEAGRVHRRLRHGLHVASTRLEAWAQTVNIQTRRASEVASDSWPQGRFEFGAAVMRARESAGLNRTRLADLVGTSSTPIANIESGRDCRVNTRCLLVEAFGRLPPMVGEDAAELGQAVGRARLQKGLSLAVLSEGVGLDPTTLSNIENPALQRIPAVARALGHISFAMTAKHDASADSVVNSRVSRAAHVLTPKTSESELGAVKQLLATLSAEQLDALRRQLVA